MANGSSYSRSGGGSSATPPPSVPSNGRVSVSGQSSARGQYVTGLADWRIYANSSGQVTSPPNYPDVSYQAYLRAGGNVLGIGYASWKDQRLAAYNTAYNMYQQWYDSAKQQISRISEAGLNTNLAYGMASPGSSAGGALAQSSGPSPEQVFFGGIGAITGLAGGIKSLAEAANIINELPDSKLKGNIARMIDAGAKAGAVNAENTYLGSLFGARNALGVGASKAESEKAQSAYEVANSEAQEALIDFMTSHDIEGNESGFETSALVQKNLLPLQNEKVLYQKNKKEFDELFSDPRYFESILEKMVNEQWITKGQAYTAKTLIEDENLTPEMRALMLQGGLPGFLAKLSGFFAENIVQTPFGKNPVIEGGKILVKGAKGLIKKGKETGKKVVTKVKGWNPKIEYDPDNWTD